MQKKVITILVVVLFLPKIPFVSAQEKKTISETVKIIAYNQTANDHVIAKSFASGTLISADGLILTNHHVVTDQHEENYETFAICTVHAENIKPDCLYTASLVAKNKTLDAAILKIDSQDIYGNPVPDFPALKFTDPVLPKVNENITVQGFPGIGGETMTTTKGQVSGYETQGTLQNLKTDATISAGNSGGTAKNSEGEFIGVPTYLRANLSTLGYIVPLTEITPWLEANHQNEAFINVRARHLLQNLLARQNTAEESKLYQSTVFPFYEIALGEDWQILFLNEVNLLLERETGGVTLDFTLQTEVLPYPVEDSFMQYLFQKLEKYETYYTNYKRKKEFLDSKEGYVISYDVGRYRNFYAIFPLENTLFTYSYQLPVNDLEVTQEAIDDLIDNLHFLPKDNNTVLKAQAYQQDRPNIKIKTQDDFYIAPVWDSQEEDLIVNIYNPNSYEQTFQISEEYQDTDRLELDASEILEEELRDIRWRADDFRLVNKTDSVQIDGLHGIAYTYLYKGEDFNQVRKTSVVLLFKGKKVLRFLYDDLRENYDQNIEKFRYVLENFQYIGTENQNTRGKYNLPAFKMFFGDLENYPYEKQINVLMDKKILAVQSNYFYPENQVSRLEAFETIMQSKLYLEQEQNLNDFQTGIDTASRSKVFNDVLSQKYNQMFHYAIEKGILTQNKSFDPQRGITLAETLKILCETYELPVWDPPYRARLKWYVPYVYKGLQLGIIPEGTRFDSTLTRGEFSALLYAFLQVAGADIN